VIVRFIDAFRHVFGVQAICRALSAHHVPMTPRTYWARKSMPPSRRALKDALVTRWLAAMFEPGAGGRRSPESLYGAVKACTHAIRTLGEVSDAAAGVDHVAPGRRSRGPGGPGS